VPGLPTTITIIHIIQARIQKILTEFKFISKNKMCIPFYFRLRNFEYKLILLMARRQGVEYWAQNQKVLSQNFKLFGRAILNYFPLEAVLSFFIMNDFNDWHI